MTIRIFKHEAVSQTGKFEVRFPGGTPGLCFVTDWFVTDWMAMSGTRY
jgi:hypothetical protein